jgi:hypothetical protein
LIKDHLAGGASQLAASLLPQILAVFSVVAPCHPGAALRDPILVQRDRPLVNGQAQRALTASGWAEGAPGALAKGAAER